MQVILDQGVCVGFRGERALAVQEQGHERSQSAHEDQREGREYCRRQGDQEKIQSQRTAVESGVEAEAQEIQACRLATFAAAIELRATVRREPHEPLPWFVPDHRDTRGMSGRIHR